MGESGTNHYMACKVFWADLQANLNDFLLFLNRYFTQMDMGFGMKSFKFIPKPKTALLRC